VYDNTAYNNSNSGIELDYSTNDSLYGNRAANNAYGIVLYSSDNDGVYNNSAYGSNVFANIILDTSDGDNLSNNAAANTSDPGLFISNSNQTLVQGQYFSNNSPDMLIQNSLASPITLNLSGLVFDNPEGSMTNYTNLSINDIVDNGEEYSINWTVNGTAPPHPSFDQNFVNITALTGTPSIDSIVWSWTAAEVAAGDYNANQFGLWKYNSSGWALLNVTPNTVTDTLGLANLDPESIYGILGNSTPPASCPVITVSGDYAQGVDYAGAPNSASPFGGTACVKISASNVLFDCGGYGIANNGTGGTTYGILLNGSLTNVTVQDCDVSNYSFGIYEYRSANSSILNDTASNSSFYGIELDTSNSSAVYGDTVYNDTAYGVYLTSSNNDTVYNDTVRNSGYGIYLLSSNNDSVYEDTAYGNVNAGIYLTLSDNDSVYGNSAYMNPNGIDISRAANDTVYNNSAYNDTNYGVYLESPNRFTISVNNSLYNNGAYNDLYGIGLDYASNNGVYGNSAYNNTDCGIRILDISDNNTIYNNSAYGDFEGIIFSPVADTPGNDTLYDDTVSNNSLDGLDITADNNTLYNDIADGNGNDGIYINGRNNTLYNDTADSNGAFYAGIELYGSAYNSTLYNNTADGNGQGFLVYGTQNTLYGNAAYNNSLEGIYLQSALASLHNNMISGSDYGVYIAQGGSLPENLVYNNTIFNNSNSGISIISSDNNTLSNNSVYGNILYGILVSGSNGTVLSNNSVFNNSNIGLLMNTSQVVVQGMHFFRNSPDMRVQGNQLIPVISNLSGLVFDNPLGDMQNYTTLSINDSVYLGDNYSINWTSNPASLPAGKITFARKFVNISGTSVQPPPYGVIDSIVWSWTGAEVAAGDYNADQFGLWKYNSSGWTLLNGTPDTTADTLGLANMAFGGAYGILESANSNCPLINVSGDYTQMFNYTGAPNSAPEVGGTACVKIGASNVLFDCGGYGIANNGTGGTTYGILLNGSLTNVTVQDCDVSNYSSGIYEYRSANSSFINDTASGNLDDGIELNISDQNNLSNDVADDDYAYGVWLSFSDQNNLANDSMQGDGTGIEVDDSTLDTMSNSSLGNNAAGVVLSSSENINVSSNDMERNDYGITLESADSNGLYGNTVGNNDWGIEVEASDSNILSNNSIYNNSYYGIGLDESSLNGLYDNSARNNSYGIQVTDTSDSNNISGNDADNNSQFGIWLGGASSNDVYNDSADDNGNYGIYVSAGTFASSSSNNITNNTAMENGYYDLLVDPSSTADCQNTITDTAGSAYRPIYYSDTSVSWNGLDAAEVELCDAPGSSVTNSAINGSDTLYNDGFVAYYADGATVANVSSSGNYVGFDVETSDAGTYSNDSAAGNSNAGMLLHSSDQSLVQGQYLSGNDPDVLIQNSLGSPITLNLSGLVFDNPSGGTVNYTTLSINDSVSHGEKYSISWASNPSALPSGYPSFDQKFVNISTISGSVSIDSIVWSWTGAEAAGHGEARFSLWKYNSSGWTMLNNTPDAGAHTLGLTGLDPASDYGILENYTTSPTISLISPQEGYLANVPTIDFDFNVTNALSPTLNCSMYLDGAFNQTNGTTQIGAVTGFPVSGIADGVHNWSINCTDQVGNTGSSETRNFTVVTTAPTVVLSYPANGNVTPETSLDFGFNETDPVYATAVCNLTVDGSSVNSTTATNNTPADMGYSGLVGGPHSWSVSCTDGANNTNTSATWNFTITTIGPTILLISPINGLNTSQTALGFTFNETDPSFTNASCSLNVEGSAVNSTTAANSTLTTLGYSVPSDGTYSWNVTCIDGASNSGSSLNRRFTVDTTPPAVTLDSPANLSSFNYSSITFNFTATDNLAPTMSCSIFLDNVLNSTDPSVGNDTLTGFPISGIVDGNHTWYVQCTDNANNTGPSATWNFSVGTTPPDIALNSPADGTSYTSSTPISVNLTFTATDASSPTMNCSLYFDGTLSYANNSVLSGASDRVSVLGTVASHAWNVTCTDIYGNTNSSPTYGFTVSAPAPQAPPPPTPSGPSEQLSSLSLSSSIAPCPADAVTISASSGEGADIRLLLTSPYGGLVDEQATGSDGTATFSLSANGTYEADASSPGYRPASTTFTFTTCPVAAPAVVVPTTAPVAPTNRIQSNCTSDLDCLDDQLCDIPPGAAMGSCRNITGCGMATNHTLIPYQCGAPSCPPCGYGQICVANICRSYDLKGPASGFVGQNTSVQALKDNSVCVDCDIEITDPTGKTVNAKTDSAGDISLQLAYTGIYDVSYIENGTVVKSIEIQALPSAATEQPSRPTISIGQALGSLWPFVLALVMIVAAMIYWRLRSGQKGYVKKPRRG
jgi:parallel beta-helix repeat protein